MRVARKNAAGLALLLGGVAGAGLIFSAPSVASTPDVPGTTTSQEILASVVPAPEKPSADWNLAVPDADRLVQYARANLADSFGGIALTAKASHINVFMTKRDAKAEAKMLSDLSIPASEVSITITPTSEVQQNALQQKVSDAAKEIRASGIQLVEWHTDVLTGQQALGVVDLTADQAATLKARFGDDISVYEMPADSSVVPATSRENDVAPWNSGDFITDNVEDCTSGFGVHNSGGAHYLLTAGHCFPLSSAVYNKASTIPYGTGTWMGTVVATGTSWGAPDLDAELIATSSSNLMFTGWTITTSKAAVAGITGVALYQQVCESGAFEGEYCFTTQGAGCYWFGANHFCHLLYATDPSGNQQAIGEGDSGGPVYSYIGGRPYAAGTVTAADIYNQNLCTNWSPQSVRYCGPNMYFTDIHYELALWGVATN